jgi:hypothetical protein
MTTVFFTVLGEPFIRRAYRNLGIYKVNEDSQAEPRKHINHLSV